MTIIQIDPLETGQHPIQSQSPPTSMTRCGRPMAGVTSILRKAGWLVSHPPSGLPSRSLNLSRHL